MAFKGLDKAALLGRLALVETREPDEANEADFSLCEAPTGWMILFVNSFEYATGASLAALSAGSDMVVCQVHEGLMYSAVGLYRDGERLWFVSHNAQKDILDLQLDGTPPAEFEAIRNRLTGAQVAEGPKPSVDFIFDIPVELANVVTGYRHDACETDWGTPDFRALRVADPLGGQQKPSPAKGISTMLRGLMGRTK